jgi:5-methylcytosine-specific restriction protein A
VSLRDGLARVLAEYAVEVVGSYTGHPLARFIRGDFAVQVRPIVGAGYEVVGSAGLGNWARTPWLSIFDPAVTTSAQKGYYVVYLFRGDGQAVFLSLNQTTPEVRQQFPHQYQAVLSERAEYAAQLLQPFGIDEMVTGRIDLGGRGTLTRGYEAGNIAAVRHTPANLPSEDALARDLHRLLTLYATYKAARDGLLEGGGEDLPPGVQPGEEARKYRWHRRAERNRRLAADAKAYHGYTCTVCGFGFEQQYGPIGHEYIEAHHLTPMAQLTEEPQPVVLNPVTDFVVVCSNCHRMLHHQDPVLSPTELRERLRAPWSEPSTA